MRRILIILTLVHCTILVLSQRPLDKQYSQWVFGYDYFPELGWGQNILDFSEGRVTLEHYDKQLDYEIGSEGALVCDDEGRLSLISNGCHISNRELEIITNGDTIDGYDWAYENYCALGLPLPSFQSTFLYKSKNTYKLIHKNRIRDNGPKSSTIKVKEIRQEGAEFQVVNSTTLIDTLLTMGVLKTTFHSNLEDVWVLVTPWGSDEFIRFLIKEDTILRFPAQRIGPQLEERTYGSNRQATFSSKNDMLAINSPEGLLVYDFDDSTGILSNYRCYKYPTTGSQDLKLASGVCFSPSDRYVYASNIEHIFQIELSSDPDNPAYYDYGFQWEAGPNGWPIGVGNMMTGPDCRIYIACATTTNFMHVIHHPDRKGQAARLQKNIPTPMRIDNHFPYVPNLFSACDSTIVFDIGTTSTDEVYSSEKTFKLYPNPTYVSVTLEFNMQEEGKVIIYNMLGKVLFEMQKPYGDIEMKLDLQDFSAGTYLAMFRHSKGTSFEKFVKMNN